ncbi:MAG: 5-bromo-4-chloroindolyl phosphate hydrolysis family protein [Lachnospiraceae bacterium]|nr:5-bromo-4-chloroindolyl phosphate hydrolysis family protein [Lachnospiraceae bacterium]
MDNQNNQRYNEIGDRIQKSVVEALQTGEFANLNNEIRDSVRAVLNDVGGQINDAVSAAKTQARAELGYRDAYKSSNGQTARSRGFTNGYNTDSSMKDLERHRAEREKLIIKPNQKPKVKFNEVGAISGYFASFIGGWLLLSGLIGLGAIIVQGLSMGGNIALAVLAMVGGTALLNKGINNVHWLNLAKRYKKLASEKFYVGVDTIAQATGTSQKKVIKNVKKILEKGFFPEGYIDEANTTLMVSKNIYDQYLDTKNYRMAMEEEVNESEDLTAGEKNKLNSMISQGMRYIDRIHELNDRIPGEKISRKLAGLENLLVEIFNRLSEHPDQMDNCNKLMDYYLPTMIKLVEAYEEYDKVSIPGDDIKSAKAEIENTLEIINQAFIELLNKLYRTSVWDVKSDAKVLQTMLKQEGLTNDGMRKDTGVTDFGTQFAKAPTLQTVTEDELRPVEEVAAEEPQPMH